MIWQGVATGTYRGRDPQGLVVRRAERVLDVAQGIGADELCGAISKINTVYTPLFGLTAMATYLQSRT